jgi:Contractile injection system tube protein/LysM domain
MPLEKLTIEPERAERISALFNPERYTLNKGVQIAEIAIPGLDSPVLQFVRGQNEKITLELFFDTTEHGMVDDVKDVREETKKIYHLLKINRDTHAPPRCRLRWGKAGQLFSFGSSLSSRCVLESVSEEFNLFSPLGVPLRAKLNVTFREYKTVEEQIKENPKQSSDRTKTVEVERGQTLSQIAWVEYQDPDEWRRIAEANNLENPRLLAPGSKLRIPRMSPESA